MQDQENSPSGGFKRKRKRVKWSYGQLAKLQRLYNESTHPTRAQRCQIAMDLGVEEISVSLTLLVLCPISKEQGKDLSESFCRAVEVGRDYQQPQLLAGMKILT